MLFFSFTSTRRQRRAKTKQNTNKPGETTGVHLMHGRKRVRLVSSAFGNKGDKIIVISVAYQKLCDEQDKRDAIEFEAMQTPEPRQQNRKKTSSGQSFDTV